MNSIAGLTQAWVSATPALLFALGVLALLSILVLGIGIKRAHGIPAKLALLISGLLLLLAQIVLVIPPQVTLKTESVVVITACPDRESLQRVTDSVDVFLLGDVEACPGLTDWLSERGFGALGGMVRIASLDDLAAYVDLDSPVTLLGAGLSSEAWRMSSFSGAIDWQRPVATSGYLSFDWTPIIAVGSSLTIQLRRNDVGLNALAEVSVTYAGQDKALERQIWPRDEDLTLSVFDLPAGSHTLQLSAHDVNGNVMTTRMFGVRVEKPTLASVLLVQDAPSFEWRALQHWLSDSGSEVAIISRVSDSRFQLRFANREVSLLAEVESDLVEEHDLIIIDGAALSSALGQQVLSVAETQSGPGVLIKLRDKRDLAGLPVIAKVAVLADAEERVYQLPRPSWSPESGYSRFDLRFDLELVDPLVMDLQDDPVIVRLAGNDRIGLTLWRDSYRAVGAGQMEAYARLWSDVVAQMARPALPAAINVSPLQSEQGLRTRVCWRQEENRRYTVIQEGEKTVLNGYLSAWRPGELCDWVWPNAAGWLDIENESGELVFSHWIAPAGHWQMERARRYENATALAVSNQSRNIGSNIERTTQPLSRQFLLLFFLLAALMHWLAQRLVFVRTV